MPVLQTIFDTICKLFTWWVFIAPWEQALRVRAGRWIKRKDRGFLVVVPFLDRVYVQSIRRRIASMPAQVLTTKDKQAVSIGAAFGYAVQDIEKLYTTLHMAEDTVRSLAASRVSDFVTKSKLAECSVETIQEKALGDLDITIYGLCEPELYVLNFAQVKTYRFITGEMSAWSHGVSLDTVMPTK